MRNRHVFRKVFLSVLFIFIAAIAAGLYVFWNFLADYEKTRPVNIIEDFVENIRNGDDALLLESVSFTPTEFEQADVYAEQYKEKLKGELAFYAMPDKSTDENPVYKIKADNKQIAVVTLAQTGEKSSFGFPGYRVDKIETLAAQPLPDVQIIAPDNSVVYVNGVAVSDGYAVSEAEITQSQFFHGYIDKAPVMVTYKIGGLLTEPEITAEAFDGTALERGDNNVFGLKPEKNSELSDMALEFSLNYSRYIANDGYFNTIGKMIPEELPLYDKLYHYEENCYAWHSDYDFTDTVAYDPVFYNENCFSCRVTYNHVIVSTETFTFPADNTVYFVNTASGWKVTDIIMN